MLRFYIPPPQALPLAESGAPAGPADTWPVTKEDLGCALGMMVKISNSSEHIDDEVRCSVKQYGECV